MNSKNIAIALLLITGAISYASVNTRGQQVDAANPLIWSADQNQIQTGSCQAAIPGSCGCNGCSAQLGQTQSVQGTCGIRSIGCTCTECSAACKAGN